MKHLMIFENYDVDEMEPHIDFHDHKKYLPFLYDYDVKSLYNQLNDLYWQMEQVVEDDESANVWAAEEEKVRQQLDYAVVNADMRKAEEETSDEDKYYEELLTDYLNTELSLTNKEYVIGDIEVEDESAIFNIEFDGEDMEFYSDFKFNLIWHDSVENVEFGNLENRGEVSSRFNEFANSYDEKYQEFINKYKQ